MKVGLKSLFVMDHFSTVLIDRDTTYAFMGEAQKRGHQVYACQLGDLHCEMGKSRVRATQVSVHRDPNAPFQVIGREALSLDDFHVIMMRKDPPYNMRYVFSTYLLEGLDPGRTLVINRPQALRDANEKCFILRFPDIIPESLVTMRPEEIEAFMGRHGGRCIVKPLDGNGGIGVFLLRQDDPNLSSLIETSTGFGQRYVMCQRYLPEASEGDKRIILIDGEPVGATLRVPPEGELRGNIHVGATCAKTILTPQDMKICERLGPVLSECGIYFAGIDVIGGLLTEVNLTSPTGIHEINRLNGVCLEGQMWDWIEQRPEISAAR